MSAKLLQGAYSNHVLEGLKPTDKVVYQYLLHRFNDTTGRCDPDQDTIAKECDFDKRNIQRAIASLVAKGLLSKRRIRHVHGDGWNYTPTISSADKGRQYTAPHDGTQGAVIYTQEGRQSIPQGTVIHTTRDGNIPPKRIESTERVCESETPSHTQGFDFTFETLTADQRCKLNTKEVPRRFCDETLKRWKAAGGKAGNVRVTSSNVVERLVCWWTNERDKAKWTAEEKPETKPITYSAEDYVLCKEDGCIHYNRNCGCKYQLTPPDKRERPARPKDNGCSEYKGEVVQ